MEFSYISERGFEGYPGNVGLTCNDVFFTEILENDFERLCERLEVKPNFVHANKSDFDFKPTEDQTKPMRSILEPEYVMLGTIRKNFLVAFQLRYLFLVLWLRYEVKGGLCITVDR